MVCHKREPKNPRKHLLPLAQNRVNFAGGKIHPDYGWGVTEVVLGVEPASFDADRDPVCVVATEEVSAFRSGSSSELICNLRARA